ncbi:ISNCY family transposase, partial [Novosphingobium aerophilum]
MTVLAMSHGELSRFDTLMRVERGELRVDDAAALLGLKRRQVFRLLDRLRSEGAAGLVSRKRGRPSNRRYSDAMRERIMAIVREHYADFGPTLAREYLIERHGITVACETLRRLMIAGGLWKDRDARRPRPYQPRYRRDCRGELIQVDGSKHWWFEDRGPQCTLLVYIDDATSELMHLKMVESESAFAYMEATREYIERHGKPVAFYSDKHSVFRNNRASPNGDGMTHFGRAMEALNIEIICANSPQAKGRVERANLTLQDRLVKAMRLAGIATIAAANAFLPGYLEQHNRRFAKAPFDPRDLHRPLAMHEDLRTELVWREWRTVS